MATSSDKISATLTGQGADAATRDLRNAVVMGLNAAILAIEDNRPKVMMVRPRPQSSQSGQTTSWDSLPSGPFDPQKHRTLEIGLRAWVEEQTRLSLGYVEQLYTFGDRGRYASDHSARDTDLPHVVSVVYLALTRMDEKRQPDAPESLWRDWYEYFPWEDWRGGRPAIIDDAIAPLLQAWAQNTRGKSDAGAWNRARIAFGLGLPWDEEKVLERYELLYGAGLVAEAKRDAGEKTKDGQMRLGEPMQYDHRRILATAMGRLRGKLKYRPVIFELMPARFTLFELQKAVEAISGVVLHKQNFRRLVEKGGFVERTGQFVVRTGGRPAELFQFRREVLIERPTPGLRVPAPRVAR